MKIAASIHQVYVCNVTYPQLVGAGGNEAADEVFVLVVAVIGVGGMARFRTSLHQLKITQQVEEGITAGNPVAKEYPLRHKPQLVVADTGIHLADLLHCVHDAHDAEEVFLITLLPLVIGLFAPVKQLTAIRYRIARIAV